MAHVALVSPVHSKRTHRGLRSQALAKVLRVTAKPVLHAWSYAPSTIWPMRALDRLAEQLPPSPGTSIETVHLGRCKAEWIHGRGARDDTAVLYLHGGALITCSLATHRGLVSDVSRVCGAPALNVDFRMMPQVTIEDMVSDCLDGYRWLLARGYDGDQIVIAGDSAGGFLAFLTAFVIRDEGLPRPAALTCMSPLLDLDCTRKAASPFHDRCDVFTVRACDGLARYTASVDASHQVTGPRVSPIDADLHDLPPTLIQIGSPEILRPDAEEMVERLGHAGVPCELQVWRGQVHVFQAAASFLPEARSALRELGVFARRNVRHQRAADSPAVAATDPSALESKLG
ncbi:alpha/beta hydrolase [Leekyejoonella antrihumi]|uniref:Alpha/beta hydrolase n=1 Tax=Leekyejoonella antrihumi TaxID=1660198 RepID=A0A563E529_9MICO|nr:alpha/beta hydrolase [Leekyejoonella antrihumi]TWP37399.1 alpha/beta hydrolase [Leekyejoonella antrihumi]